MDDVERLRRFCIDDPALADITAVRWSDALDRRTVALIRLAGLIATAAPTASMRSAVDEAVAVGVTVHEIMAVLDEMVGIVGLPRAVAAAPRIAVALGVGDDLVPDPGL